MKVLNSLILSAFLACGLALPGQVAAEDPIGFSQAELDRMLAPVALYPDSVLSHVLIAATYPLEVVQAARWSRNNPGLRGEDAVAAVEYMDWDPSVKALVAFPDLLARMDEDLDWTQSLGDAFLLQEGDVVESIQHLRDQAYAHGSLRSNEHVRVVRETEYIYIEPARTRVLYVPYYDPRVVYGHWRWSAHPPVYWHRPHGISVGVSFHWGSGYHIAPTFYFSSFHWARRQVVSVHHHHHHYFNKTPKRHFKSGREVAHHSQARHWKHDPEHRRGVSYRQGVDERRFVQQTSKTSPRASARQVDSRPETTRIARQRTEQRNWANERRDSLKLRAGAGSKRDETRGAAVRSSQRVDGERSAVRKRTAAANERQQRSTRSRDDAQVSRARSGDSNKRAGRVKSSRQSAATRARTKVDRSAPAPRRELRESRSRRPEAAPRTSPDLGRKTADSQRSRKTRTAERGRPTASAPQKSRATARPSRSQSQPQAQRPARSAPKRQQARPSAPAREKAESRSTSRQRAASSRQRSKPERRTESSRGARSSRSESSRRSRRRDY